MREAPSEERPRERLLRHGPSVLGDAELLAVLLGSGIRGEGVIALSRRLLDTHGGLTGLLRVDVRTLQRTRGLGPAKAAQVSAAIEIGRRGEGIDPSSRPKLDSPEAVFGLLGSRLRGRPTEQLHVLALDTRGRLLGAPTPIEGGVSAIGIRPADVFREPVVLRASSVILVHNHPSGDPAPSPQDIAVTRQLVDAGSVLDMEVLDHVIIGHARFVSLRRDGRGFPKGNGHSGR